MRVEFERSSEERTPDTEVIEQASTIDLDPIRNSVREGVRTVVKPFLSKVQRQMILTKRSRSIRIGGPDDPFCHPFREKHFD